MLQIKNEIAKLMYRGRRNIMRLEEYNANRAKCIKYKTDATFTAFSELEDIIDKSQLAYQYFDESPDWLTQRIDACMLLKKDDAFTEEEFHQLAEAFRDIAQRLQAHADEIDTAEY